MRVGFMELIMIGLGLSMDAFAAAVSEGLQMQRASCTRALKVAATFGLFQAAMPVLGFIMARRFEGFITAFDHWIAFGLLTFIGGKMAWDARDGADAVKPGSLLLVGVATSIDALAVGITFAFMRVPILPSAALIGMTTFAMSMAGVCVGSLFGARCERSAQMLGGLLLTLMGCKILLSHLIAG